EINRLRDLGDTSIETAVLLGDCLRLDGRAPDAIRVLQDAARQEDKSTEVFVALGRALASAGEAEAGAQAFLRALAVQPNAGEALEALADLALARSDFGEARRRLEAMQATDPHDRRIRLKLGTVLVRSGDLQPAIGLFETIVQEDPRNAEALVG